MEKTVEYARMMGAEVVFLYCHRRYPRILGQPYRDQVISEIKDQTAEIVRPFLEQLEQSGIPFVVRLMEEPAGAMIPEVAENEKCELIIMGSRGLSNLQGLIIGSVTNRVLHTAGCPVLVVK
jgi:nucleotide-binding universal stress UspA family protein